MESLFFHPKVVHLPIALAVISPLATGAILLACWRQLLPRRAWIITIALQALLVASGAVAMWSGEAEEEVVEAVVSEDAIEAHAEAAEAFVYCGAAILAMMLGAYVIPFRRAQLTLASLSLVGTVAVLGLGYRAAELGGELVYRHGAAQVYVDRHSSAAGGTTEHEPEADEDDDR